ncbi:putative 4-coumarate-CoA ligase 1 [Smittium culicis]|uniref:Putative 4-coumarate-CoA ligase 1 n=1 Tax=Smittium culicis TaxID=133412 RepID=A0A1R1XWN5_9FUNG|nr:putative 4-coumarate-CoA ligase 1 [Smittium culicis]OMJ19071.1 putative 4-coumarate-CoA ligase 1 [Smittium culicis]
MIFKSLLPDAQIPNVDFATYVLEEGKRRFAQSKNPNNYALFDCQSNQALTIHQLDDLTNKFASGLYNKLGFKNNDTLLLYSPNSSNFVITCLGTLKLGGVVTFSNPAYNPRELSHQISDSKPRFISTCVENLPTLFEAIKLSKSNIPLSNIILIDAVEVKHPQITSISQFYDSRPFPRFSISSFNELENKYAFLPYSSGTTGLSKGVILSHKNIVSNVIQTNIYATLNNWHNDPTQIHRYIGVLPWYHIYGLGVGVVSLPKFEMKSFLETVQTHKISIGHLVPPILINLVNDPIVKNYDISSLKFITTAAAPIGKELMINLANRFKEIKIVKIYGVTESSPIISCAPYWNNSIESSGILTCNQEAKVIDEDGNELEAGQIGELLFRGPNIMLGYLNNPSATSSTLDKDNFLHTGDIGYIDEFGNLFVVDRKKELIKYKGFQVPPAELEALLLGNDDVADAAVIGIYVDEQATEVPKAFVTLKSKHANLSESEKTAVSDRIREWVNSKVSNHKKLRGGVQVIDIIPKSTAGKILRRVLRDTYKGDNKLFKTTKAKL